MTWVALGKFKQSLFNQQNSVDWDDNSTTTIKFALLTSAWTPNIDADQFWSDISANEVSGTNYTAGGVAISNRIVTSPSSGAVSIDGDDPPEFAQSATGFSNARYAVLYKDTGTSTTSPLICYYDLGSDRNNTDASLSFSFDASGILTVS